MIGTMEIKTYFRDGKYFTVLSGLPDGSSYQMGPFDKEIEAESKVPDILGVLVKVFGEQIKNIEWRGVGEA